MKIILKSLNLINFKGIKQLSINFDGNLTNLLGDNATGKTTVFDAFTWLFFGKESTDRKDFNIKNTVDDSLNRQDHEVNAVIEVNGSEIPIRRIYKEKWVKKRGEATTEFSGHETEYFWDDVPANQSEFNAKINALINESVFKLTSNPAYFNSLNWKDRRNILFDVAGMVTYAEIAQGNPKYERLVSQLTNDKSLDELRKQIAIKKKLIKETLEKIPSRIDEVNRNMPDAPNTEEIHAQIEILMNEINEIDLAMVDRTSGNDAVYEKISQHQGKIHEAKQKANQFKFDLQQKITSEKNDLQAKRNTIAFQLPPLQNELQQIESQVNRRNEDIKDIRLQIAAKRKDWDNKKAEWTAENDKEIEFNEHEFSCPTCKRAYESDNIEGMKQEMVANFNADKDNKLQKITAELTAITAQGKLLAENLARLVAIDQDEEILALKNDIQSIQDQLTAFDNEHSKPVKALEEVLNENAEYSALLNDISVLEDTLPEKPEIDVEDLKVARAEFQLQIDNLNKLLANTDVIDSHKKRIVQLEEEEVKLANELAEYEGEEFLIDSFNKKRIEAIESRINGKFKFVTFKMFASQINGGEMETCETMVGGVPYSDLNNAARINAGLDIINALCEHYGVSVPCFIDNAESITQLIDVQSQIIRLVVSEVDKKLRVA